MNDVIVEKVRQASDLLQEFDLPLWIVQFGRETYDHPQPVQELLVGTSVTWPAAFLIAAGGDTFAIAGTGDLANVRSIGAYREVIGYVQDVGPALRDVIMRFDPPRIGVSYSVDDDSADNITHGMYLILEGCLRDTPYARRLTSADRVLTSLRARKMPSEIERIRAAVDSTLALFSQIEAMLKAGITERQVADAVHASIANGGMTTAWDRNYDPVVNFGAESAFGHARPTDITLEPGMLVHVDLGVKRNGYCSDMQRMWYMLRDSEDKPPEDVAAAFDAVLASMHAGFAALKPGVQGWQVDAEARKILTGRGYDEPEFSLGHQLGQTTHDGGCLLGPRWPRYGNRPHMRVEEGNVFTLEYALRTSAGTIGLEEDVVVTADGAEYLSPPQTELRCLRL